MNINSDMIDILMEPGSPVRNCVIPGQVLEQGWWFGTFALDADFVTLAKLGTPITFGDAHTISKGMYLGYGRSPEGAFARAQQLAWGIQG